MRIASNRIKDIKRFAYSELENIYRKEEIGVMIAELIEYYCQIDRPHQSLYPHQTVLESDLIKLNSAIKGLRNHIPIQYIIGHTEFYDLRIGLEHKVLIPRQETEELVHNIIKENKGRKNLKIADLGTGSGAIALALRNAFPDSKVYAYDIDPNAIMQTKLNSKALNLEISIIQKDILEGEIEEKDFDIIVSNPPYVMNKEKEYIRRNVLDNEPELALFVEDDNPLIYYFAINKILDQSLKQGGRAYMEINEALGRETAEVFADKSPELLFDLNSKHRFIRLEK